jgi:aldose 1-epimerase
VPNRTARIPQRHAMGQTAGMFELRSGDVMVEIAPEHGGRLSRLVVGDRDLIFRGSGSDDPMQWGSYPMVPWAGRLRGGQFSHAGEAYQLPITMGPHAIHGTVYLLEWERTGDATIEVDLGGDWPFGGRAVQHFAVTPRSLTCVLEVHAGDRPMPAMIGWHPWFVKPDRLDFTAGRMFLRDGDYITDGTSVAVPPGPWDDCFADVQQPIIAGWGDLTMSLTSSCDIWVVYDQPEHATCIEPQSGAPDAFNTSPFIVEPGVPLVHSFTVSFSGGGELSS